MHAYYEYILENDSNDKKDKYEYSKHFLRLCVYKNLSLVKNNQNEIQNNLKYQTSHHITSSQPQFQERNEIKAIIMLIKHMRAIESVSNALSQHLAQPLTLITGASLR